MQILAQRQKQERLREVEFLGVLQTKCDLNLY